MSKNLEDYTVECHCNGWFHNDRNSSVAPISIHYGQKFTGTFITERMIRALEGEEDFMAPEGRRQVLSLNTGEAADLRLAFEAAKVAKPKTKAIAPKTMKEAKPKVKRKRKKKAEDKPTRTPRPNVDEE